MLENVGTFGEKAIVIVDRDVTGKLKKSFFANSGAEGIEGAVRLAKRYSKKNEAIALTQSFHGRSYATLSLTGNAGRKRGGGAYMAGGGGGADGSALPPPRAVRDRVLTHLAHLQP